MLASRARSETLKVFTMAESKGFEPLEACTSTVFETVPFVRSGNSPGTRLADQSQSSVTQSPSAHHRGGNQSRSFSKYEVNNSAHSSTRMPPRTS